MKRIIIAIFISSAIYCISSCGPSAEERARIASDAKEQLKQEQANKAAIESSLKKEIRDLSDTKNNLIETKAALEAEKDRMNSIKGFQLGRTAGEREQQIMDQSIRIQKLESNIEILQSNIPILENNISGLKIQLQNY